MKIIKDLKDSSISHNIVFKYDKNKHKCHIKYQNRVNIKYVKENGKYYYFVYNLLTCEFVCLNLLYCNPSINERQLINQALRTINNYLNLHDKTTIYYDDDCMVYDYDGIEVAVWDQNGDIDILNNPKKKEASITSITLASIEARHYDRAVRMLMSLWDIVEEHKLFSIRKTKKQEINKKIKV